MKSCIKKLSVIIILLTLSVGISAQGLQKKVVIIWNGVQTLSDNNNLPVKALCAEGLINNAAKNFCPFYHQKFNLPENVAGSDVIITNTVWEPVPEEQLALLTFPLHPDETITPNIENGTERGVNFTVLSFVPLMKNVEGKILRLKSFQLDVVYHTADKNTSALKSVSYASHSVLSQGSWYKIQIQNTGIYKITYADLKAWGVDMSKVTPDKIRLFGNGGGMLPEANSAFRYDDLVENAISVVTAASGVFASGDYILFYGTSPNKSIFDYQTRLFEHSINIYSDYTYYFLNFDGNDGLRIQDEQQSSLTPTYTSTFFTEGLYYEKDKLNFNNSGKSWVGERMDINTPNFELPEFTFANTKTDRKAWIDYHLIARAVNESNFIIKINGNAIETPLMNATQGYDYATETVGTKMFTTSSDKIKVSLNYTGEAEAIGWLDWIQLNVSRDLKFTGGQMAFADPTSILTNRVTNFQLSTSSAGVSIWEVSNPLKVMKVASVFQDGVTRFTLKTDSLRSFIALDNTSFLTPTFTEMIANQDLHSILSADLLIVTHKDFLSEANRIAQHHRSIDGYKVSVVTNEQVYNEFSSGAPDVAAIRDFCRMLYKRPDTGKLKFLLLFGDGTYDYKDRIPNNTNKVLTFQSKESLNTVNSYVSDDFFGILDDNEGDDDNGYLDIGIGRFPVSTLEQAKIVVDKSLFYAGNNAASFGEWRNRLCLVSDDGNGNYHFEQVEKYIFPDIDSIASVYNVNKVYLDAFTQISTPSGQRCPDANTAINTNVSNGALVVNYTGHGGEKGWADENILSVRDIDSWTNFNSLPVFFTATCEFSRFDNPALLSAGEHVLLNPVGGSVALFTTTRPAVAITNLYLTRDFYDTIFSGTKGNYTRFGNAMSFAKNEVASLPGLGPLYIRNFLLLGDPAIRLSFPENKVITTQINGKDLEQDFDTIPAMAPVELKGIVADDSGIKIAGFNGVVNVKVFDKSRTLSTLGTDPGDFPETYTVQDNYIYQGRASVTNGEFTIKFIVPRDIDYSYGIGKISYYAYDSLTDANGYCKKVIIGGSGNESADQTGPQISLFINDLNFIDGGITGDTPLLIAKLNDESGINTISNAIGHEIVAMIDGDYSSAVSLNSYYSADIDSYQAGIVRYKFPQLTEGKHTLTLKAWDVFNNSSEATITFEVVKGIELDITKMNVYPNPFWDEVKVYFEINLFDAAVTAHLDIYSMNGALVASTSPELLVANGYNAGILRWNGCDASGSPVTPGVYLVSVRAKSGTSETVKASRLLRLR